MSELRLFQLENGYRYNSDTLFLYNFLTKYLQKGSILDVGCGCGVLGLLIKRDFPDIRVDMIDLQKENVALCKKNGLENGLHVDVMEGDFLDFDKKGEYEFVVSNPPFYHEGVQKSKNPHVAKSRYSQFLPFNEMVRECYGVLKPKGRFCFCYDAKQLPFVFKTLLTNRFGVESLGLVYPKKQKEASLVLVLAKRDFKGMCKILPPFVASDEMGYTDEAKEIFKKANTVSLEWKD